MYKKIIFSFLLFLFFSSYVYSTAQNKYTEGNQIYWSYEYWETKSNYYEILNNKFSSGSFNSHIGTTSKPTISGKYGRIFRFPKNTEDYIFKKASSNMGASGFSDKGTFYFTKYTSTELSSTTCKITLNSFNNNQVQISSNLKPLKAGNNFVLFNNQQIHLNSNNPIEHLLEKYYYMKTEVKADLYDSEGDYINTWYPNEKQSNSQYSNFVLLKPNRNVFNLDLPNKNSLGLDLDEGTPYWKISVTPIDLKCDFNNDGNLENNSKILENNEIEIISKNFPIKNNKNNCQPTLTGPINNEIFKVKINENQEIDSTIFFKVFKKRLTGNSFYKKPVIEEEKNIKLSKTEEEINLTKDFDFDKNNLGFGKYKYEILIKTNDDFCSKNSKPAGFSSDEFKSENKIIKTISDDLIKKSFLKDKEHFGKKIGVSVNGKNLYFDKSVISNISEIIVDKQLNKINNEIQIIQ